MRTSTMDTAAPRVASLLLQSQMLTAKPTATRNLMVARLVRVYRMLGVLVQAGTRCQRLVDRMELEGNFIGHEL